MPSARGPAYAHAFFIDRARWVGSADEKSIREAWRVGVADASWFVATRPRGFYSALIIELRLRFGLGIERTLLDEDEPESAWIVLAALQPMMVS
jgi:hypothetical protein